LGDSNELLNHLFLKRILQRNSAEQLLELIGKMNFIQHQQEISFLLYSTTTAKIKISVNRWHCITNILASVSAL